METKSQHLLLDIWVEKNLDLVINKVCNLVRENFNVVKETGFKFEPQGETIVFILAESHFSLHSYPEHGYLTMDIYTCNLDSDLLKIKDLILLSVEAKKVNFQVIKRGF